MPISLKLITRCGCTKFIDHTDDPEASLPREIRVPLLPKETASQWESTGIFKDIEEPARIRTFHLIAGDFINDYPTYVEV